MKSYTFHKASLENDLTGTWLEGMEEFIAAMCEEFDNVMVSDWLKNYWYAELGVPLQNPVQIFLDESPDKFTVFGWNNEDFITMKDGKLDIGIYNPDTDSFDMSTSLTLPD